MKKLVLITGIILVTCTIINAYATTNDLPQASNSQYEINSTESTTVTEISEEELFIIKQINGRIAVFKENSNEPYITTDTFISNLPENDINRLKNGIKIYGKDNLRKALEDYCS